MEFDFHFDESLSPQENRYAIVKESGIEIKSLPDCNGIYQHFEKEALIEQHLLTS